MSEKEQKQKILDQVAKQIDAQAPRDLSDLIQTFTRLYYANVPLEDLAETPVETLSASVYSLWEFSLKRIPDRPKIRVFTEKQEIKRYSIHKTIVEIVNDNMPFLVDSVTGVINSLGHSIHLVIHPVMQVERDENHVLVNVSQHSPEAIKGQDESIIHCEILELSTPEKLKELEEEITRALEDVRFAVKDWASMRQHLEMTIKDLEKSPPPIVHEELEESLSFLKWMEDNNFTFLGYCEYSVVPGQTTIKKSLVPQTGLGVLRDPEKREITYIFDGVKLNAENRHYIVESDPLIITKTTQISPVHRRDPMDSITVKGFDGHGNVIKIYQFVGLFTSVVYNRSARDIPLLRRKISRILDRSGFSEQWHDGKTLVHILESFPRDELFQASEDWLYETSMAVLQLQNRQRLTLFIRPDHFGRFVSCIVYVPRDRYDSELRQKMGSILEGAFKGKLTNWQTQLGELAFARIHYSIRLLHKEPLSYDHDSLENELVEASLTWRDHLQKALMVSKGEQVGLELFERYGKGFSKGYQERFSASEAIIDIEQIEQAFLKLRLRAHFSQLKDQSENMFRFKIYSLDGAVSLSHVLPVLENMNLNVSIEIPFVVTLVDGQKVWIHDFEAQTQEGDLVELDHISDNFLEGFSRIWRGEVENDGFNRLIIRANFGWQECQLIRAYAKYIRQLQVTFSQAYIEEVLAKYPLICQLMLKLFSCQFSPEVKEDRERAREEILNRIKSHMENVDSLDEDRILGKFINAISSTLRTNYYQLKDGKPKSYISFKINCAAIDEMALPRPLYEIFIYSPRLEAIHLRGGKVARGGIRWSDRKEDFRTEVLGLMKAQMVKNAVIVPEGSKGGFIVKRPPAKEDRNALLEEVVACYKIMMCGLLDLTDNIKENEIVHPQDVVRRDGDDSYLVVAADKGTSTFSDYANQISNEYDFWLGDAFASGGSSGYDHKKMGITARGAWESVKVHFRDMGRDANRDELTVVGIGDMSGDVFGNGVLLSQHLKLLAAFNHSHIFMDPSPDPKTSYSERKRLFHLAQSNWSDYNKSLISSGGGVFERRAKSIEITPQMKVLFEIREDHLTPNELIRYLLKAQVDLIWFGGIGTYIKAKNEANAVVGDRANDPLRVNGMDVRAKVIAEGANLGVTQLGRIEYAKNGGRINTDAIDNSAGVDCSDHEVNIKILFGQVLAKQEITLEKRNILLEQMTDDVASLILKDNFWQNQVISLARSQGLRLLDEQARLMRDLENEGLLNRALEDLPDETEIARRMADKQGLTRPELAILLAYAKISLKQYLIHSEIPDLNLLQPRLLSYFPERLQYLYQEEIKNHPLKRELAATLFTGSIVNRMGMTFVHEMKRQLGVEGADVARAYLIVRELLDLMWLWSDLELLEHIPQTFQTELMLNVYKNVKRFTDWFLRFNKEYRNVDGTLQYFKSDFDILREDLASFFVPSQRQFFEEKCQEYEHMGLSPSLAERLLSLEPLVSAPDIIMLSKETNIDVTMVARVYFAIAQQLGFEWLQKTAFDLSGETHWNQGAANAFLEELYMNQRDITKKVLAKNKSLNQLFNEDGMLAKNILPTASIDSLLFDLMNASTVDFSMLMVISRQLRILAQTE
ncbi:MAG: NAD-glutamate dehydrogenase [Alphaproteobacteria bacterium]|nr:NAD-glutamate dehydrogenase [Alphaproteobacteria bacterium]